MRIAKGKKICIICEGYEESDYIDTLKNKRVFSNKYEFKPINVKSINNIVPRYQEKFQSDSYSLVLIFCDTDKGPSDKYKEIKQKINEFHEADIANDIIIFGNPSTMQIILSHFTEIKLKSQSKSVNAKYIEELIGIQNYKATEEQRKELFSKIKRDNYDTMKENVRKLSTNDEDTSSTNILKFIERFESDNDSWIDKINSRL
ncbi:MAG: hypothetical protein HFJ55_07625 [Clostridia bacterium]|nr:hypothetical protein [Clostridia bacterium]